VNPAIEIPAKNEDALLRARDRGPRRGEVRRAIYQEGDAVRALDAPAVAARNQQVGLPLGRDKPHDEPGELLVMRLPLPCTG
jgi:hypothetical protein